MNAFMEFVRLSTSNKVMNPNFGAMTDAPNVSKIKPRT